MRQNDRYLVGSHRERDKQIWRQIISQIVSETDRYIDRHNGDQDIRNHNIFKTGKGPTEI